MAQGSEFTCKVSEDRLMDICGILKEHTGIGCDNWHPQHWTWLSPAGKRCLRMLVLYIARHKHSPLQVMLIIYFMLLKPCGGLRPIGLLPSLVRLVERVHAFLVEDWERART